MNWKEKYQTWLEYENLDESLKQDLQKYKNDESKLEDAFYTSLEFGTAGMRGIIGAGTNRMNIYTVRQATEGLALFIENQGKQMKERGVAIAYDSRHMSKAFAVEAALTLAHHGIKAYVFEELRPTPELSFAVRHLKAAAGIMITASHNPPEYNGYKVYGDDGGQLPPKEADELTTFVRSVEDILSIKAMKQKEAETKGLLKFVGKDIDKFYLEAIKTVTINQDLTDRQGRELKIVFTPLHGTGQMLGEKALRQIGFKNVSFVEEQSKPDPDFTTVKSPNPEDPAAFELAIEKGKEVDADVLIATDPDADRLGVAVRTAKGHYEVLTGNQIAALMVEYIFKALSTNETLPRNSVMLKSIVSSELPSVIGDKYGVETINVLTGFKFIAEKIKAFEADRSKVFMYGFEESYGYLVQPFVRDKDAIQALVMVAEMTAYYKEQGYSLFDTIHEIYHEYGHYKEKTISVKMDGMEGTEKINAIMNEFRSATPESFGGVEVSVIEDFKEQTRQTADTKESMDLPPANVLKYTLADSSWIAVRPSGTEPKIKFYISARDDSGVIVSEKLEAFEADIRSRVDL
ncbi:MAG: phospho-sugar mutase [Alkalibacterium sp.]|uniref:Phosphoglucomutase n=1 Tax=Alkalibacterium gilvum TaxID=1130080 RepID=A0A1H6SZ54_9LACT|nr:MULTISPECIES: phospho-sugar mutase [Alkalibacterium]MDN6194414.1 phospho-sugar mutase [Alkalibacterium sp.]MDN6293028.1 phospho-sugar mutase [Alkalibacterium sp.]MDN6296082.1 phospho-sugar mutase [Alkalibacterium sp.]MDN6327193.1 phospho-sugar mutase [Alkalibacterium sp.]MDN6397957.1 phospho-sugar mutase [Alkalibacterium sp.]